MMRALHDAIAAMLVADTTFLADLHALTLGSSTDSVTPQVLRAMRPLGSLGQEHFPCWVMEPGDDETTERAIGSCHQGVQAEILLHLVWHQQDETLAYYQRLDLRAALTALFLRNPCPDGLSAVYVDAQGNDRAANHPTHITSFRLLADVNYQK